MLLIAVVPIYWATDADSPVEFIGATVKPEVGVPGARVTSYYKVNVLRGSNDCTVSAERLWEDAKGFRWPSMPTGNLPYGVGPNDINLTMAIPMDAAGGPSKVSGSLIWSCNPWQMVFPRREPMPVLSVIVQR